MTIMGNNLIWVIIVSVFLVSCTPSLSLIKQETAIQGDNVSNSIIRVDTPFTFQPAIYSATYPAGVYVPKFEDYEGVYFRAPDHILGETIAGGRTMEGGIYVSKQSWSQYQAYINEGGAIYKFDIPFSIDITILKKE